MEFSSKLGFKIKELRTKQRLSQDILAERIGISSKYLGQIERGAVNVSALIATKIASALGVKAEHLLDFKHAADSQIIRNELHALIDTANEQNIRLIYRIVNAVLR